jgi:hypothetical protein
MLERIHGRSRPAFRCLWADRFEAVELIRRDLSWRSDEMISALVIVMRDPQFNLAYIGYLAT